MQTTTPKLTRLTKTAKIQVIKDAIKEGSFDRDEMAVILGVKDRQVRRYLNEIAKQDAELNPGSTQILRSLCLYNLTRKAALGKLSTTIEVGIVLAGESRKLEVTEDIQIKEKVLHATIDLTKLAENDRKTIFDAEEALTRAETATSER